MLSSRRSATSTAMTRAQAVFAGLAALLVGCGGDSSGAGGSSTTSATTGTGGSGASGGAGGGSGGSAPICPAAVPAAGAACSDEGMDCSFGDDVIADCRPRWSCSGGKWADVTPMSGTKCAGVGCPPMAPMSGGICDEAFLGSGCGYADGTACTCMNCLDQGGGPCMQIDPPQWICPPLPTDPGCPAIAPNAGTACDPPTAQCLYYGACGLEATCEGGAWVWKTVRCAQ